MTRIALRLAAAATAAILLGVAVPLAANHTQTDTGKTIVFDHRTGNEWWVEVIISGSSASSVVAVEVQTEFERIWKPLEKKSWGPWGGSHHFPAGEPIRFRATFSDGVQAVSCWFTHPGGTETCLNPPPPSAWSARKVATSQEAAFGLAKTEIAMADVNRNGRDEMLVPTQDGLYLHERDASGAWTSQQIMPAFGEAELYQVVVGDLDDNGLLEAYSTGHDSDFRTVLYEHKFNGVGWESNLLALFPWTIRSMVVGDIEEDGRDALYLGSTNGFSNQATYLVTREPDRSLFVLTISTQMQSLLAIGDADRDGDDELYSAGWGNNPGLVKLEHDGAWYDHETIPLDNSLPANAILATDGDNDGQEELYVLRHRTTSGPNGQAQESGVIFRHSIREAGWTTTEIPLGPRVPLDMVAGDADNDGRRELYVVDEDGRIQQVRWTGTGWSVTTVAQAGSGDALVTAVIGDSGGDGPKELYAAGYPNTWACCPPLSLWRVGFASAPPPPPPGTFDATFTGVRGNEWWIQAQVTASGGTLASVHVSLNGGDWKPLAKQSWGGWAASYRAVQGTVVQLRATSTTGATDLSDCYQWIPPSNQDAAKVQCGTSPPPPPPPSGFDATFSGVKGNEWWVQVSVSANQPLAGVDARVNCGTWVPLAKQSWGGWAKSFHVPDGSKVDFRARSTGGGTDVSGGYIWPSATPTSGC